MKASVILSFLAIALLPSYSSEVYAQAATNYIPTVYPKSPNSAAFDKYGNYPVSMNSGVPEISIPLYTVESGSLKVPITLSYHASGNRVNDAASWVGLGWSLSTGGSITRTVMGKADEEGYIGNYKGIASLDPYRVGGLDSLYGAVVLHSVDTRPDIYAYSFPGKGGKFFYNGKNQYKVTLIPYSPIIIKDKFTILDESGNKYLYGSSAKEVTSTYYTSGSGATIATTAWMLETMLSQTRRDTIQFSYVSQNVTAPDQTGQTTIVEDDERSISQTNSCPGTYVNGINTVSSNASSTVTEQEVSQIDFKNGKVAFKMGHPRSDLNGVLSLDTMKVYVYDFQKRRHEVQKSVVFYKSYYAGLGGVSSKLRLDSVHILDKAGSITQHYRFTYDSQPLPSPLSFSKDRWGYYNGRMDDPAIQNKTLIPRTQVTILSPGGGTSTTFIGADEFGTRDPDTIKMQAAILTRIDFPTGGHTDFTYQTNRYYDSFGSMILTGGLRVTAIKSFDSPYSQTPMVKTYQYTTASPNFITSSSGQLNYGLFTNEITYRYWSSTAGSVSPAGNQTICKTKRVRTYTSDPGFNLTPSEGNPVAYTSVSEFVGTPNENAGKTVYTYTDIKDALQSASSTGIPIIYDYSFARGQLKSKTEYLRKTNGSYQPVQSVVNAYSAFPETRYDAVGVVVGQRYLNDGAITKLYYPEYGNADAFTYPASSYGIVSDDNYLISSTTQNYDTTDPSKSLSSNMEYKYDNIIHQQISRTRKVDSRGNTRVHLERYAADYLPNATSASTGNSVLDAMLANNMQNEVIEQWDSLKNISNNVNSVVAGQLSKFKAGQISGTIVPEMISRLYIQAPLVNDFTPAHVLSNALVYDSKYVQMIAFNEYDLKNNNVSYTPRNGTTTGIIWDQNYALPVAQVKNATNLNATAVFAYTSFEADGKGGWSFTGKTSYDVTAPTGTRSYRLSTGTITSPYLDNTRAYVLSVWAKGAAPVVQYSAAFPAAIPLRHVNGWTYYEYRLPANGTQAIVSGSADIDELRLYPSNGQMATYTYNADALVQMTDTKGMFSRFEYDFNGRLTNMKDWRGNIIKNITYHTYDMTFGNQATAVVSFTRDNCPENTSPESTTYSVPANKYRSSSQASANAMADYDLRTNGQLKADDPTICDCSVQMVNFTLSNSTGIGTFTATFSGAANYSFTFPANGSTTVSVAAGTYSISINPTGNFANRTFKLGSRSPVVAPGYTFNTVNISPSYNESPLIIQ